MLYAAVINCMDGRVQECVNSWIKENAGADYIDVITEPGPVAVLAASGESFSVASLRRRARLSVEAHGSRFIAVAAHEDCAGNPVPEVMQRDQLKQAARRIQSWDPTIEVAGLWVSLSGEVEVVAHHPSSEDLPFQRRA